MIKKEHVINGIVENLAQKKFRDKTKVAVCNLIEDLGNICESFEQAKRHSLGQAVIQVLLPKFYEAVNRGINDSPQEPENPNEKKPILVDIPAYNNRTSAFTWEQK
jgi:hypothetical protein